MAAAESITAALLAGVAGGAAYPVLRPDLNTVPAVVWNAISVVPDGRLTQTSGANLYRARIQVDCFERTYTALKALVDSVRAAMHLKSGPYAGKTVVSSVLDNVAPDDIDPDTGVYSQSVDVVLIYYD